MKRTLCQLQNMEEVVEFKGAVFPLKALQNLAASASKVKLLHRWIFQ